MFIPCLQVVKLKTCFQDSAPLAFVEIQSLKKTHKATTKHTHTEACGNAYLTHQSLFFCIVFFCCL